MATVLITLKVMPESPDVNLDALATAIEPQISAVGKLLKTEKQPIAFGLHALVLTFSMDEDRGSTEDLEHGIAAVAGVQSVDVTDVRRAIG